MQIWVQSRLSGVLPVLASAISLFPLAFENRSAVPYIDNVRMGVREQQQNSAPEVFFLFCFCASCLYTQNKLLVWCNRGPSSRKKCSTAETLIKIQAHCVHFYYLTNFTKNNQVQALELQWKQFQTTMKDFSATWPRGMDMPGTPNWQLKGMCWDDDGYWKIVDVLWIN
jgi:hypothetical protein